MPVGLLSAPAGTAAAAASGAGVRGLAGRRLFMFLRFVFIELTMPPTRNQRRTTASRAAARPFPSSFFNMAMAHIAVKMESAAEPFDEPHATGGTGAGVVAGNPSDENPHDGEVEGSAQPERDVAHTATANTCTQQGPMTQETECDGSSSAPWDTSVAHAVPSSLPPTTDDEPVITNPAISSAGMPADILEKEEEEEDEDYEQDGQIRYTDQDIQRDASSIAVMAAVNVALLFFAGLFACAVAGSILFMGQFGFVTLCLVLFLVGIVGGTVAWIVSIIAGDEKLRPVRRKMDRWQAIAKAVVVNEIVNFRLDMQEHMLLTDGRDCGDDEEGYYEEMGEAPEATDSVRATNTNDGKSRSVIFGLLVKPFVKGRKKMLKRKLGRKKKKSTSSNPATQEAGSAYIPPAAAGTQMV